MAQAGSTTAYLSFVKKRVSFILEHTSDNNSNTGDKATGNELLVLLNPFCVFRLSLKAPTNQSAEGAGGLDIIRVIK